uniref:NADH dehydrogenase subunit 2 n=1 Tax=Diopatra cuprea TaxID=398472 RepID=UPI001D0FD1B5|nr:NADH dehydrogenase subunit 2 [Diopatra cuprea]QZM06619.1 NADH dehydrogenase subunit 2 [Diopatra cuprea]
MQHQKPYLFLFFSTLLSSTIMAISSSNFILLWISLELNMMSFIPILSSSKSNLETEAAIKYFLAQATGSGFLLLGISSISIFNNLMSQFPFILILSMGLLIKMGAVPFHFWFPHVMSNISWLSCIILSTWQKIIPIMILSYYSSSIPYLFLPIAILSASVGALGGLKQSHLPSLMAYSSIAHLGWMISSIPFNSFTTIIYFIIYSISTAISMLIMNLMKTLNLKSMISSNLISMKMKLLLSMSILSLGGMPPLLGFIPKIIILKTLLQSSNQLCALILLLSSVLTLSYYLNMSISSLMSSSIPSPSNPPQSPSFFNTSILTPLAILTLGLFPLLLI